VQECAPFGVSDLVRMTQERSTVTPDLRVLTTANRPPLGSIACDQEENGDDGGDNYNIV
jgi:hypothetical protein